MKTRSQSAPECTRCSSSFSSADNVLHQLAESLGAAIDAKDSFTSLHSEEVAEVSHAIALAMGLSASEADIIHVAGHLHDIGKIGVSDGILKKAGPLTDREWDAIKRHPDMGAEILKPVRCLVESGIVEMVRHHHERYDGNGYPNGLSGQEIPVGARIICLADSMSAMLQDRPYRPAQDFDAMIDEVVRCTGTQFDTKVVTAFLDISDEIQSIFKYLAPERKWAV